MWKLTVQIKKHVKQHTNIFQFTCNLPKLGINISQSVTLFSVCYCLDSTPRLESLEIARGRFRTFNSKYIESIKSARGISPPRDTNFPHWLNTVQEKMG
jgi:hypothetical protein